MRCMLSVLCCMLCAALTLSRTDPSLTTTCSARRIAPAVDRTQLAQRACIFARWHSFCSVPPCTLAPMTSVRARSTAWQLGPKNRFLRIVAVASAPSTLGGARSIKVPFGVPTVRVPSGIAWRGTQARRTGSTASSTCWRTNVSCSTRKYANEYSAVAVIGPFNNADTETGKIITNRVKTGSSPQFAPEAY